MDELKKPYLIQRSNFCDRDFKKGIDSILKFDYMGSAEFEFGALPDSLGEIRNNVEDYTYMDVPIENRVVTVFCLSKFKNSIEQLLIDLSDSKFRTKEYHAFDDYIKEEGYFQDRVDLWWDLVNNMMFWRKNPEFETKFKSVIENKPE